MQATARTVALNGLQADLVRVEVDSGRGLPCFHLVGLPEACVRESRQRVRAALGRMDVDLMEYVVTVNLGPAYLRKSGSAYDLAIAVAVLAALGRMDADCLKDTVFLGELSLSGCIQPVRGVLPSLMAARDAGVRHALVPVGNFTEAAVVEGIAVVGAEHLEQVVEHLRGERTLECVQAKAYVAVADEGADFCDVRGQEDARRALEVSAAGSHNLLMMGPPGAGKTMLARRLPSILPPMQAEEAMAVTAIHSVVGLLRADRGLVQRRPFRAPHHTISSAALLGGGQPLQPGEVSLAHHGVLFLDELLEFPRHALEGLRQPLETGEIAICRARYRVTFPANPLLVAAMNPCPCGFYQLAGRCSCKPEQVARYMARLSGPLLDRIDLHVGLSPVALRTLQVPEPGESSKAIRQRVLAARDAQWRRFREGRSNAPYNASLDLAHLESSAPIDSESQRLLERAESTLGLTARSYVKVRRVARTIADLAGRAQVEVGDVQEALARRFLAGVGQSDRRVA